MFLLEGDEMDEWDFRVGIWAIQPEGKVKNSLKEEILF